MIGFERGNARVAGIGALLAAALLAGAGLAAAAGSSRDAGPPTAVRTVHVRIHYSGFEPGAIHVEPGQTIRFAVENTDPIDHEFIVGDEGVQSVHEAGTEAHHAPRPGEISVPAGRTVITTVTFPEQGGSLLFGCHLPGHYAYGMRGTIAIG